MHKEGLELSFALDIDDASTRTHVAQSQKDATRLLRHLQGEPDGLVSILVILHDQIKFLQAKILSSQQGKKKIG